MKTIFTFFCALLIFPGFAETIGQVEYHLPNQEWVEGNRLESPKGTTIIYIPLGQERHEAEEFFGVNSNIYRMDFDHLHESLINLSPGLEINLNILERDEDSVLGELSVIASGRECANMYGWIRIFSTEGGTVILAYQTEREEDLPEAYALWLPVLRGATLLSSSCC